MNVAFCLFKYFPYGGLQRDFLRIALECQRRGCSVRVYTLSWEGDVPPGFDMHIVPVHALSNHRRAKKFAAYVQSETGRRQPAMPVVGFNKLPGLDVYYAADACYKEKSLTQRGLLYRLGARYRIYAAFEEAVFGKNSKTEILMISKMQEPFFIKHYGTPVSRMHFLPPNIALDRVAPPDAPEIRAAFRRDNGLADDMKLLVQIGSGFIKKGVDRSIRALAALPDEVREKTVLWVVGKDRTDRFEQPARTLGVGRRVIFTGGRDDIPQILLGADLMIHPAYDENTGTVLLEAVAAGLPVLCTEVCGYSSHIKAAGCGLITPEPFDQTVLNRQLEELLTGRELPKLGKNALAYARSTDLYSMHERAADVICSEFRGQDSEFSPDQSEIGNRKSEIFLNDDFKKFWAGKDPFAEAFRLEGEVFRSVKTRRTFRFELNGRGYFAKIHHGIGWREVFKNLLQFKIPVLGARNEYEAIRRLEKLGVATMKVAAFGGRGRNPARIESFIITEELVNTVSLEDFCRDWKVSPPPFALKRALIDYVAKVSRILHRNGVNHRDYYICHFLLDVSAPRENGIKAPLIDLHRAQLRKKTPRRWAVKDIAGLYFSAMELCLTPRDLFRFMTVYSGKPLRETLKKDAAFWRAVDSAAERLYAKEQRNPQG
ncbi:MAG: lipopolysaccharide core heptose(I) kinase RfaP [Kiritimatiellales bacterium]